VEREKPPVTGGGRVVREVLFQSASRYLGAVLGIVRGLVFPKLLDPAMYGVFKSYQTLSELSRMATAGVPSALFRELPIANARRETGRAERLLDNAFWSTILSAVPFAAGLLVGGLAGWIRFADVHFTAWYLLFVPLLFVDRSKIFFDVVFTGQKQFVFQAKLRLFDEVATTCLCLMGAWAFAFDGFLAAMLMANGLATAIAWWGSGFRLRHAIDLPLAREMVIVGFPQLVVGLSNTIYNQLDRMAIVAAGFGMAAVGWYSVGMTICEQVAFGSQIVARVLMPRMMEEYGRRENVEDIRRFVVIPTRLAAGLLHPPRGIEARPTLTPAPARLNGHKWPANRASARVCTNGRPSPGSFLRSVLSVAVLPLHYGPPHNTTFFVYVHPNFSGSARSDNAILAALRRSRHGSLDRLQCGHHDPCRTA
jgi:O-antigen/teichoic acid export membrane protein